MTGWIACRHCGRMMNPDTGKDATDSDACHSEDAVFGWHENPPDTHDARQRVIEAEANGSEAASAAALFDCL